MKGALIVSRDAELIAKAAAAVERVGGCVVDWSDADHLMLCDPSSGHYYFIYGSRFAFDEEGYELSPRPGVVLPDGASSTTYVVECRSETLFAQVSRALAQLAEGGTWVVDGNSVGWDAVSVDPDAVQL